MKVKRRGDDRKFLARVLAVGTECDIALMTVEDDAFWEGVDPLTFGTLPHLQDAVAVVGYPVGGETISVTSGAPLHRLSQEAELWHQRGRNLGFEGREEGQRGNDISDAELQVASRPPASRQLECPS